LTRLLGKYDDATYYLVVLPSLDAPFPPITGCRYFRLVVFLDKSQILNEDNLVAFINSSLDAGARSVLCGGSAGEHVHDVFDGVIVERGEVNKKLYDPEKGHFIPTTWHDDEPVDEVLWQASSCAWGHDDFESFSPTIIVAVLARDPRVNEIRRLAEDFSGRMNAVVERS
jgi:hypothetical protein